jgi:GNAT superfamily N-acetyltransferase
VTVTLRELDGNGQDIDAVQHVLDGAPGYTPRVTGRPVGPADAEALFAALPPGLVRSAKHVFGVDLDGTTVGVVDLLDGWPDPSTTHLGLLLLDESHQHQGIGSLVWQPLQTMLARKPHVRTVRTAVVQTNIEVLPFWTRRHHYHLAAHRREGPVLPRCGQRAAVPGEPRLRPRASGW